MKKIVVFAVLVLMVVAPVTAQNNLTPDQIRRHAVELGVPFEALQRLVNAHQAQTGLANPNANTAQLLSIQELNFMRDSDMLSTGSYYRTRATFSSQSGRRVFFIAISPDQGNLFTDASFLINIPPRSAVDALIGVRADFMGRPRELFLVEIAVAR